MRRILASSLLAGSTLCCLGHPDGFSWTGHAVLLSKSAECNTPQVSGDVVVYDTELDFRCNGGERGDNGRPEESRLRSEERGIDVTLSEGSCSAPGGWDDPDAPDEECTSFSIAGPHGRHRIAGEYCSQFGTVAVAAYLRSARWTWRLPDDLEAGRGCIYELQLE